MEKNDKYWQEKLSAEEYRILRQKGTEAPFSGKFLNHKEDGTYTCAACGNELFDSNSKFDSGCGWPSFFDVINNDKIISKRDTSHGMIRTEILCANCEGHLGHVFDDGPRDKTGLRYCINSVSLGFKS